MKTRIALAAFATIAFVGWAYSQQVVPPADTINCAYNTTPPAVTNGQMVRVQCDTNGRLISAPASTSSPSAVEIVDGVRGPVSVNPASTAAPSTALSLTVQLNPLSPGIIALGQTTKANSAPVAIASDQLGAAVKTSSLPVTFATDQYLDPCMNPLIAKSSTAINITSATTTQLVAVSGTTSVYVCGFDFTISEVVTTANTLQFEYGTSTNCTGTNKLTGLFGAGGITAGAPLPIHAGYGGTLFTAPASQGLCALTAIGASGSFQGFLSYVQQ